MFAVFTGTTRPVFKRCSSSCDEIIFVVISVSAAVPAPQQLEVFIFIILGIARKCSITQCTYYMFLARKWIFSQFLDATIGPSVARVSAPNITPSLKTMPQIVVPVLIAVGQTKPFRSSMALLK